MLKPRGTLPRDLVRHIWEWAQNCVEGYDAGEKPQSLPFATRGIEGDRKVQAQGKAGECGLALCFGLDPTVVVDWSQRPDRGTDIVVRKVRVDVKRTKLLDSHCRLFWPHNKRDIFESKMFDALALVKTDGAEYFVAGWISKSKFRTTHRIARPDGLDGIDEGDLYVMQDELEPIEALGASVDHFDDHACITCGLPDSPFSSDFGKTWYCAEHNPDREQHEQRLAAAYARQAEGG